MRRIFALVSAVFIAGSIWSGTGSAQTPPPPAGMPSYDPAIEQTLRRSCNTACVTASEQCRRDGEGPQSPCATSAIACFIGCRDCISTYRACRTDKAAARSHEECLQRELSCVLEKRKSQEGRTDLIRFSGGDGTSAETAVVIEGARNEDEGIVAELYWASRNRPGWRKSRQSLISFNSRQMDRISFISPDGKEAAIFFDITGFFGKM